MTRDEFIQANLFMFSDVRREIQLAKADPKILDAAGVNSGGGNFLAALALLCYTEFGGKLKFGVKQPNGRDNASANFNQFFDLLGADYKSFREVHNVYDIFRCGLAHEYYVKKSCAVAMFANSTGPGISTDGSGRFYFVVESYCRDLEKTFENLQIELYGS